MTKQPAHPERRPSLSRAAVEGLDILPPVGGAFLAGFLIGHMVLPGLAWLLG